MNVNQIKEWYIYNHSEEKSQLQSDKNCLLLGAIAETDHVLTTMSSLESTVEKMEPANCLKTIISDLITKMKPDTTKPLLVTVRYKQIMSNSTTANTAVYRHCQTVLRYWLLEMKKCQLISWMLLAQDLVV